jgi:hypothetical protein
MIMLKTMYVLTVLLLQSNSDAVVVSRHSTLESCQKAFQSFKEQFAKNTVSPTYATTPIRTFACTETEHWMQAGN